jgi:hypothetical protein
MNDEKDDPIECQIERINCFIKTSELYALYHLARVTSGETKLRKITRGDGSALTDDEKIADSLQTVKNHISNMSEATERKIELMKQIK